MGVAELAGPRTQATPRLDEFPLGRELDDAGDGIGRQVQRHGAVALNLPPDTITRIIKFTPEGKFIKAWGSLGSGPSQFRNAHALAFDSRGRLFVADRVNGRIQIFNQDGKYLTEYHGFGFP